MQNALCLPARQLMPLPDEVSFADGATSCDAGMTALHAVDRAEVAIGDKVLVIGIGGVGSIVTQLLARSGAQVIAADIDAAKEEWALGHGASGFSSVYAATILRRWRER